MPSFTVYKGSESGKITKSETTRPDLKRDEVLVKVTTSGVCGTDEHYKHVDMGLGHEGAGVVSLREGVGWGYEHDSCGALHTYVDYETISSPWGGKKEIDVLLVTTSAMPDWNVIIPTLAPTAMILPLTVAEADFAFPYMPLLLGGYTVQGAVVAARAVHRKMLAFAALHDIKPVVMKFPMTEDGIEAAMGTLRDGKKRYRGVLISQ